MAITESSVLEELRGGETGRVEFKATLRWNLKAGRIDEEITYTAMKAIASLMNKQGGAVYIGVEDGGSPRGLREDGYKSDDQFRRLLIDAVKPSLGQLSAVAIEATFHEIGTQRFVRVECPPAKQPVYVRYKNREEFWVRAETQTIQLPVSQIHSYIEERFGKAAATANDALPSVEFRDVIREVDTTAEAFRRFAQDVDELVRRGKWVFNIAVPEPAAMAEAQTRLSNAVADLRTVVLAARKAATEIRDAEAIYDSLGDVLRHAESLVDLVDEIRNGMTLARLEKDERYLGFMTAGQAAISEIRQRFGKGGSSSGRAAVPSPAVEPVRTNEPYRPAIDYWSMSDNQLEKLAEQHNIPPLGRAGKEGEHWYVDRDRIIATLVERDRHLAGTGTQTAKTSSVPPLRVPVSQAAATLMQLSVEGKHLFDDATRFTSVLQESVFEWVKKVGDVLEELYWSADVANRFRGGGRLWSVNDLQGLKETTEDKLSILEAIRAELRES